MAQYTVRIEPQGHTHNINADTPESAACRAVVHEYHDARFPGSVVATVNGSPFRVRAKRSTRYHRGDINASFDETSLTAEAIP